ncbi:hypothetical protein EI94DRAFT_1708108 [Lactarius quietus]|nr:hypothetical protein EI94DRAFT_1708108 [Lactarius quietus]
MTFYTRTPFSHLVFIPHSSPTTFRGKMYFHWNPLTRPGHNYTGSTTVPESFSQPCSKAFAHEWGFMSALARDPHHTGRQDVHERCGYCGTWNGEAFEGFVVRTICRPSLDARTIPKENDHFFALAKLFQFGTHWSHGYDLWPKMRGLLSFKMS